MALVSRETPVGTTQTVTAGRGVRAFTHDTMGMTVSLHVRAVDPYRADIAAAAHQAFSVLDRADRVFSPYRAGSELMQIRHGKMDRRQADPWYAHVESLCAEATAVTGGLFTADLLGPDGTRGFDPTGLVKGWAAERAVDALRTVPDISFCLNAAGDLIAGTGTNGVPWAVPTTWRVGIADADDPMAVSTVVTLEPGQSLATSGTAQRGQHITDPRTGEPAATTYRSITVTGPDLTWADVWATCSFIDSDALAFSRMAASYRVVAFQ